MALAQDQFLIKNLNTVNLFGGSDGSAVVHSSLPTTQLSGEGTYCRGFVDDTTNRLNVNEIYYAIKSSVDGGAWVNNLQSYAFSLRAWVRILPSDTFTGSSNDGVAVGLFIGFPDYETVTLANGTPGPRYSICINRPTKTGIGSGINSLRLCVQNNNYSLSTSAPFFLDTFGTYSYQETLSSSSITAWYRIRLDVIPTEDSWRVRAYRGTGSTGSETWSILNDEVIIPGTGANPVSNPSMGFFYQYGRTGTTAPATFNAYIDRFTALGEDLTS